MKLSILIVNWNTRDLLRDCLQSVAAHPPDVPHEVIVVDNASADGSAAMVQREFPGVRLVASEHNWGFAKGNNEAMRLATGELLLLLNPDTVVLPGALVDPVRYMEEHPRVGAVGVKLLEADGRSQESCGLFPSLPVMLKQNLVFALVGRGLVEPARRLSRWAGLPWMPVKQLKAYWDFDATHEVDWICGAYLLVRRAALAGEPLFDERFLMYGEDIDLCRRIRANGYGVVYLGGSRIVHYGGASSKDTPALADAAHFVGTVRFYQKHHGALHVALYRGLLFAASLVGYGASLVRSLPPSKREALANQRAKLRYRMKVALRASYKGFVKGA